MNFPKLGPRNTGKRLRVSAGELGIPTGFGLPTGVGAGLVNEEELKAAEELYTKANRPELVELVQKVRAARRERGT